MHELPLLISVSVALAYALAGGLIARRLGLPTIVGYLLAGVALGPFTPGYHADEAIIGQLAEFGVILLMFGVGIHFSFRDLWQVRRVAMPGALLQLVAVAGIGYGLGRWWGLSTGGAWVLGIAISVASTVVVMRSLMDHGWTNTPAGRVAIGWLVFEDLLTVAILVLLPVLFGRPDQAGGPLTAVWAVVKAALFVGLMLVVGDRVVPWLLGLVVHTRSRELFVLVALTVAAGTALASSAFFGVSLALGAFVAGVVVSESPFSHQISADLLPFREAFAVVFFVSVGMLVNPMSLVDSWDRVLILSFVIIVLKGLIAGGIVALLPSSARTVLVLTAGRGQIGEFSFIVAQSGLALNLIDQDTHGLILAGAIVSITINPLVVRLVEPAERALRRRPRLWNWLDRHGTPALPPPPRLHDHVVIVGCGRVGRHIAEALGQMDIPRLVVESDPRRLAKLVELRVPVLFGDAGNSEILDHAELDHARALVITLPDDAAVMTVAVTARRRAPSMPIIARASTFDGAKRLRAVGVEEVVRPELEGGLEIVRRTLLDLALPAAEVQKYTELVRREGLDETERPSPERARMLADLLHASTAMELSWVTVPDDSPLAGRSIADSRLRSRTGATIVAIGRGDAITSNPAPEETIQAGDRLAVIGLPGQVGDATRLFGDGGGHGGHGEHGDVGRATGHGDVGRRGDVGRADD
ncbi:MAG: cation:proton antiporter [Vicinamibacterales bacterium]